MFSLAQTTLTRVLEMFLENATAAPFIHAAARLPTSVHPLGLRAPVRRRRSSGRRPGRRRQRRLRHADPCAGRALEPARRIQHARWGVRLWCGITNKPASWDGLTKHSSTYVMYSSCSLHGVPFDQRSCWVDFRSTNLFISLSAVMC